MLPRLHRLACKLTFLHRPLSVLAIAAGMGVVYLIVSSRSREDDLFIIPGLLVTAWSIATLALIHNFNSLPADVAPGDGFFMRVIKRIRIFWQYFLAVVFAVLTVSMLLTSLKLIAVWMSEYWRA